MGSSVHKIYGNRMRLRVCGLLLVNGELLMVNHKGLGTLDFWAPPGGGVEYGESAEEALKREIQEETGLEVTVRDFLFACEFIKEPFHAVELFFKVEWKMGSLRKGKDPESGENQIISEVAFLSNEAIRALPEEHVHGIFRMATKNEEIMLLKGYFKL